MKKKWISFFMAIVMSLCLWVPVFASSNTHYEPHSNPTGVLTTDDGTRYLVEGVPVNVAKTTKINDSTFVTYRYDIPTLYSAGGSTEVHAPDDGYSSTVYLTIQYNTRNTPTEYLLTRVSGYWEIADPRVSVESASVSYGCSGAFPSLTAHQSVLNVPVTNNFGIDTGFTDYVASGSVATVGANLTVNYLMGTSRRWSFTLENNIVND